MMLLFILSILALTFSAIPAVLFFSNLRLYRPPPQPPPPRREPISILVPARNEENCIAAAIASILTNQAIDFELLILDDHSEDQTADIVKAFAAKDPRVKLLAAPPLPAGWCGKQHACQVLADHATHDWLLFLDADVRLAPNALARLLAFMQTHGVDLASGFPWQETGTLLEKLIIPIIHFLLLGFLPLGRMRANPTIPAYAAGCGQLFIAKRASYRQMGGHATIKSSLHDGIKLPRAFRAAGLKTDLFDATTVALCRMYTSGPDLWRGFSKNATEGLASSLASLIIWTLLLGAGQLLPVALYVWVSYTPMNEWEFRAPVQASLTILFSFAALVFSYLPRLAAVGRFRLSLLGALLHPLGITLVLLLQWTAWVRSKLGWKPGWKGREYGGTIRHSK